MWKRGPAVVVAIALASIVLVLAAEQFNWIVPKDDIDLVKLIGRLTPLFVVAVLIERAVEVMMIAWRGKEKNKLETAVRLAREEIAKLTAPTDPKFDPKTDDEPYKKAQQKISSCDNELQTYRGDTQQRAVWASVGLAFLASAMGISALDAIYSEAGMLDPFQDGTYKTMSIVLTAGLLAGGSDGFHKIMSTFTTFFETMSQNIKRNAA